MSTVARTILTDTEDVGGNKNCPIVAIAALAPLFTTTAAVVTAVMGSASNDDDDEDDDDDDEDEVVSLPVLLEQGKE